jgi:hypothetical protein
MMKRKYDKPWHRRWLYIWPVRYAWKVWNPLKVVDKSGHVVPDIYRKWQGRQFSKRERARRTEAGEAQKQWFSCKVIRSLDLKGD